MSSLIYYMFGCPKCYVGLFWIDHPAHCYLMILLGFEAHLSIITTEWDPRILRWDASTRQWTGLGWSNRWLGVSNSPTNFEPAVIALICRIEKLFLTNLTDSLQDLSKRKAGQGQAPSPPQTHSQPLLRFGGKGLEVKLLDELSRRASFTYSLEVKDWSGLVENRRSIFMNSCFLRTCSFLNSWSACSHEPGRPIFPLVHKHLKLFFWIKLCMYAVWLFYVLIRFTFKFQDASVSKLPSASNSGNVSDWDTKLFETTAQLPACFHWTNGTRQVGKVTCGAKLRVEVWFGDSWLLAYHSWANAEGCLQPIWFSGLNVSWVIAFVKLFPH